jgi:sulfur carrier protein ThiS
MEVSVNLFGNLGHYLPEGGNRNFFTRNLPDGATVGELLKDLNLQGTFVVVVNGGVADVGQVLKANDAVSVFRPSGGG